jgi:hypothetical protein
MKPAEPMSVAVNQHPELVIVGGHEEIADAANEIIAGVGRFDTLTITQRHPRETGNILELRWRASDREIKYALGHLLECCCIDECPHTYTRQEAQDDTRWLAPDGLHERSNPDITVCDICGAWYNDGTEEWQYD